MVSICSDVLDFTVKQPGLPFVRREGVFVHECHGNDCFAHAGLPYDPEIFLSRKHREPIVRSARDVLQIRQPGPKIKSDQRKKREK